MNPSIPNCCIILYEELRRIAPAGEWVELSVAEIAEHSRFSKRTIYRNLPILVSSNFVIKKQRTGRGIKNRYCIVNKSMP